jgi:hypothetical protein
VSIETSFLPWLHFLGCMAQRSLHVFTKIYYRSMSCFAMVLWTSGPHLQCKGFPHKCPLLHNVAQEGHKVWCHFHSTEHDTQPIVYLISKQVVPYRTRGGTCCPGVSTPKIQSLPDSSTSCCDGINHLHHCNHCSNHSINHHHGQLTSRRMGDHHSQRHKSNWTS